MLTFKTCPFCVRAREYLDSNGITYNDVILEEKKDGQALRLEMAEQYGRTSVPAIWINSDFIGGWSEGSPGLSNMAPSEIKNLLA